MEPFNDWVQIITGAMMTLGVILAVISWQKGVKEHTKERLKVWDRVCFITGAILFWATWYSGNEVSSRQQKQLSLATNRIAQAEAKQRPRDITPEQQSKLIECLRNSPKGKVVISAGAFDGEATGFAKQIENVLGKSGFEVVRPSFPDSDVPVSLEQPGLHIVVRSLKAPPAYAPTIQRCFKDCGIIMEGLWSDASDFDSNRVEIAVGQNFR